MSAASNSRLSRLPHRRDRLRQVDPSADPRPRRGLEPLLRARALARGDQPAHALAAPAGAGRGGHRRAAHLPRGAAAGRVRADREGRGAGAADRGHAPLRPALARRRRRAGSRRRLEPASSQRSCKASCRRRSARRRAEAGNVRDFLLNEALKRLAADAAVRLSALVAGGEQIPFDVAEQDGPESAFYRYEPLTSRFVLEREEELRGAARLRPRPRCRRRRGRRRALSRGLRASTVPADPRERAAKMLTVFLASLWEGCTEFSLDRERLDAGARRPRRRGPRRRRGRRPDRPGGRPARWRCRACSFRTASA